MNTLIIKRFLSAIVMLTMISHFAVAQGYSKHEVSVFGAGGLGTIKNKTSGPIHDKKDGMGGSFGLGYKYNINSQWGILTGVEYSMYSTKMKMSQFEGVQMATDYENDKFEYRYKTLGYSEKQNVGFIQIPIMVQYLIPVGDLGSVYLGGGAKIGFATSKKNKASLESVTTEGYYSLAGGVIIESDIPEQGFGVYKNLDSKKDLNLNTAVLLALEAGMKWNLPEKMSLYTGVYFDYGLNNINKKKDNSLINFNLQNPEMPILNNLTESTFGKSGKSEQFVDKITPMAAGLKIRLAFGL